MSILSTKIEVNPIHGKLKNSLNGGKLAKTTFMIDSELFTKFKLKTVSNQVSMSDVIRDAMYEYVND